MARVANNVTPKKNPSEEKLRATPFQSVAELEAEAKAIRLSVWRKFNQAQVIHELLTKSENAFIVEEWKEGLVAFYGNDSKDQIFRIYSEGKGLKLKLNKEFTQTLGEHEMNFVEGVVRAGIEGFGSLYLRAKSLVAEQSSVFDVSSSDGAGLAKPQTKGKRRDQKSDIASSS